MANKIQIDIDSSQNYFRLSGTGLGELLSIRTAQIFLRDSLSATINEELVQVPYEIEEQEIILQKIQSMLKKFGIGEEITSPVKKILEDYFREETNFGGFSEQAFLIRNNDLGDEQKKQFEDFVTKLPFLLPNRFLYSLQLLAAYHLTFSQNACNFSVPGAGKTTIVYATYAYLNSLDESHPKHVDKLLIVGPLSSFGPWESEYRECFGKEPFSKRLSGGLNKGERTAHFYSSRPAEITLLSYNSVPNISDDVIFFLKRHKVMMVLDEAHKIKNTMGGITAESVLKLAKYCRSRVVLTGTPAPNGYEDIYNLFKFIWPIRNVIPFHLQQLKEMSENLGDPRIKSLIIEF